MPSPHAPTRNEVIDEKLREAEALARLILETQPENPDALHGLGLILMEQGDAAAAIKPLRAALNVDSDRADSVAALVRALNLTAESASAAGQFDEAAAALEQAIDLRPNDAQLSRNMAFVLCQAGNFDAALGVAESAVDASPDWPDAHDVCGQALSGLGRMADAALAFQRALDLDPANSMVVNNWGRHYLAHGDYDQAIERFEAALALDEQSAEALNNLGIAHSEKLEMAASEAALRQALSLKPDFASAHFNLAMTLLMQEKFAEGWNEYEWRWACPEFPSTWREFPYPFWNGEPLDGKTLLVWSEQGVGDEMMFANVLPDAYAAAGHLIIECNNRFQPLFRRSFPNAEVVVRTDPANHMIDAAGVDYQVPMASLCRQFRRSKDDFPTKPGGYLIADEARTRECRERYGSQGPGKIVGISWRSGNPVKGPERSAPLALWDGILSIPGINFVCLQYGDVEEEIAEAEARTGALIFQDDKIDPYRSVDDWFAQVAAMDMVINVDNSTIQVSGSLGVPTWCMAAYVPEWRFGMSGERFLWHPSIRLFRQPEPGEWESVFREVAADLPGYLAAT